ncbi:MAG: hypothetical protein GXO38_02140 [Epsilonproteobacteria bacterium]|nr:hypothetical protein [Campylobacterota bacterium]
MKKLSIISLMALTLFAQMTPKEAYDHMVKVLPGEWKLSPASQQKDTTGAHNHPAVKRLLGTDKTAMEYEVIGRGSSLKEELLPGTIRHMVTMYHCDDFKECNQLLATHYCAKQNQPSFIFNTKESTKTRLIFDCDEDRSEVCDSDEPHVHHIILELSDDYNHLKASYIVYEEGERASKHTIYHFDKK